MLLMRRQVASTTSGSRTNFEVRLRASKCRPRKTYTCTLYLVAALQLTNLYKQGRKNSHHAFLDGYMRALRDTLECMRHAALDQTETPQMRLDRLYDYVQRRLETLQSDMQDQEDMDARPVQPAAATATRSHRTVERKPDVRVRHAPSHDPKRSGGASHGHTQRMESVRRSSPDSSQCVSESETETQEPLHDHPRKRRRAIRSRMLRAHSAEHGS